ncbi:MAG: hypothetical protein ABFD08_15555, partial [Syntrophomonas sp.]
ETIEALQKTGIEIFRVDKDGTILASSDGQRGSSRRLISRHSQSIAMNSFADRGLYIRQYLFAPVV